MTTRKYGTRRGPRGRSGRRFWTPEELDYLRAHFPDTVTYDLAETMGRKYAAIHGKAHQLGIKKSEEFFRSRGGRIKPLERRGSATMFKPGQSPWNKGLRYQAGGRSKDTQYKKGHSPANRYEVGALRINADGYLDIKVAPGIRKWVALHRWNWKRRYGAFPPAGVSLIFKDGDRYNCEVENLQPMTRADLMRRNTFHNYGPEMVKVIQLKGALTRQINKRTQGAGA